ncbi:MAG: hypothetical protein A2939_04985 [Parcubacteria group bacterium RIFCSPLOWO2_01_FULL_48_18]|nr:MAG: hypothetical protein A2939_04985 [Parcubacteria group bacterium RIFCSPLOWO2_01_FULL_48_18]OHB24241.1 MAG: hypothetical protein A3J67_05440 [Parcubacteria group bacterium RIFCSPHIGHO2_02_FULL_48_10b]
MGERLSVPDREEPKREIDILEVERDTNGSVLKIEARAGNVFFVFRKSGDKLMETSRFTEGQTHDPDTTRIPKNLYQKLLNQANAIFNERKVE